MPLTPSHRSSMVSRLTSRRSTWVSTVPGFTFNPTNCKPMSVTGTVTGVEGASSYLSSRFQVTNCNRLQTITSNSLKKTRNDKKTRTPVPFSHHQETQLASPFRKPRKQTLLVSRWTSPSSCRRG